MGVGLIGVTGCDDRIIIINVDVVAVVVVVVIDEGCGEI